MRRYSYTLRMVGEARDIYSAQKKVERALQAAERAGLHTENTSIRGLDSDESTSTGGKK
jgi:hypothetical protein